MSAMKPFNRPQKRAVVSVEELALATLEYSDIMITLSLHLKFNDPTKAGVRACAEALKVRMTTSHSAWRLNQIIRAPDPYGQFLLLRREINTANIRNGLKPDTFL